jgi:hypothetical protein
MPLSAECAAFLAALRNDNPRSDLSDAWAPTADPKAWPGLKWADSGEELEEVCVDGLGLAVIPHGVDSLGGGLKKLWVSNNGLRALPPALGRLAALESLMCGSNLLRDIPPEIGARRRGARRRRGGGRGGAARRLGGRGLGAGAKGGGQLARAAPLAAQAAARPSPLRPPARLTSAAPLAAQATARRCRSCGCPPTSWPACPTPSAS